MRRIARQTGRGQASTVTAGVTDLMTSLAIIFILLFVAHMVKPSEAETPPPPKAALALPDPRLILREHFQRLGLALEPEGGDPLILRVVIPEELLNFETGKSTLSVHAQDFLEEAIPAFAEVWCGPMRPSIESVVIEGHTDDRGEDRLNLKLSQERSFSVMTKGLEVLQAAHPRISGCFQQLTSASGRGKQDLIFEGHAAPNRDKSRRVVFKIRLRPSTPSPIRG
ncbi:MAG: OmpA family protein [Nitrospira sp.]|nr:MAG: OmpA family protein [Nitrospira sp.]